MKNPLRPGTHLALIVVAACGGEVAQDVDAGSAGRDSPEHRSRKPGCHRARPRAEPAADWATLMRRATPEKQLRVVRTWAPLLTTRESAASTGTPPALAYDIALRAHVPLLRSPARATA